MRTSNDTVSPRRIASKQPGGTRGSEKRLYWAADSSVRSSIWKRVELRYIGRPSRSKSPSPMVDLSTNPRNCCSLILSSSMALSLSTAMATWSETNSSIVTSLRPSASARSKLHTAMQPAASPLILKGTQTRQAGRPSSPGQSALILSPVRRSERPPSSSRRKASWSRRPGMPRDCSEQENGMDTAPPAVSLTAMQKLRVSVRADRLALTCLHSVSRLSELLAASATFLWASRTISACLRSVTSLATPSRPAALPVPSLRAFILTSTGTFTPSAFSSSISRVVGPRGAARSPAPLSSLDAKTDLTQSLLSWGTHRKGSSSMILSGATPRRSRTEGLM